MTGRKSKYSPELVEVILNTLRTTGSDKAAIKAARISRETFYDWIKTKPDFSDQVAKAKTQYRLTSPSALREAAQTQLWKYLSGAQYRKVYTKRTITDPKGQQTVIETETIAQLAPPQWAIERVLGTQSDLIKLIYGLLQNNVIDAQVVDQISTLIEDFQGDLRNTLKALPSSDKEL